MKKFFILVLMLLSVQAFAQDGIRYTVNTVEFTKVIDSTTVNDYTKLSIDWDKGYKNTWFTGGNYTLYLYPDTSKTAAGTKLSGTTVGDLDSLFIYVKARVPTTTTINAKTGIIGVEVENDSLFITPSSGSTGFTFVLDMWYQWDFELPRCRGVDIWLKRQCDAGGLTYRFVITK